MEQAQTPETTQRFFNQDDFQYILIRSLTALTLSQSEKALDPKTCVMPQGNEEFFPSNAPPQMVYPMPRYFANRIRAEWKAPLGNIQSPSVVKKNYRLLDAAEQMLQTPKVDAPITALQS